VIFPLLVFGAGGPPAMAMERAEAPVAASRWDLPPTDLTRRAVLLGGHSAMATLLGQQGTAVVANLPFAAKTGMAPQTFSPGPQAAATEMVPLLPRRPTAAASDSPNVFGSVALSVGGTSVLVYAASATRSAAGETMTGKGRVLTVCARAPSFAEARRAAYARVATIARDWATGQYRNDIGASVSQDGLAAPDPRTARL
jgi:hypothetical protein